MFKSSKVFWKSAITIFTVKGYRQKKNTTVHTCARMHARTQREREKLREREKEKVRVVV